MLNQEKEKKIISAVEEITGIKIKTEKKKSHEFIKKFRQFQIKKILLISSTFDYFLLEEEGRLKNLFSKSYSYNKDEAPPDISHVETGEDAIKHIQKEEYDLIIIFNKPQDTNIENLAKKLGNNTNSPIVVISNNLKELLNITNKKTNISKFFTWNGDGKIILSIVQSFEDVKNLETTSFDKTKRIILLIEDSIQHYSTYLTLINDEINKYLKETINKKLSCEQKTLRYKSRPFIYHTTSFSDGEKFFNKNKDSIVCIISDNYLQKDNNKIPEGVNLAEKILNKKPELPILIQSSEPLNITNKCKKDFLYISKKSPRLIKELKFFLKKSLGPNNIILKDKENKDVFCINNLEDLEKALMDVKPEILLKYAQKATFSNWLKIIGEIDLADKFKEAEMTFDDKKVLKNRLFDIIEDNKYSVDKAAISSFSRNIDDPFVKINRIGDGALGGKARGIAFIAKLISNYIREDMFPELNITVPRSIVLSTDVFDAFLEHNNLSDLDFCQDSDDRIATNFMDSELPATILGDLRSFIRDTRKPLIVRSSGLLEDSLMQPFAGIYASVLLPNESWETDLRFQEACNAIKYVYASTFFQKARTYIKSTPKNIGDEKMGVLIQEVTGQHHDNYFYPTISGVAKSYNYYPSGPCKQEDGIVYLALGLGKAIVDGGSTYAFCPEKPKAPLSGTPKDFIRYAQNSFYALNLRSIYRFVDFSEETSVDKLDVDIAKKHGILEKIASTYVQQDDRLYPGLYDEGYLVVDFAPIINYEEIPLAKSIKLLLKICEIALGYPVEIEFAVNISKDASQKSELIILQVRNMVPPHKKLDLNIDELFKNDTLLYSENSLGHGIYENIFDIVYVNQDSFDMSKSNEIVNHIRKINTKLMGEKRPYVLIGPGRWGSSDPWLGIPVIWSDIAGAKIIVETPYHERHIDPSQGSHFFHDMIASEVGYIIIKKQEDIDWKKIKSQKVIDENEYIKHIQTKKPIQAIIDGKKGKAVVRLKPQND